MGRPPKNQARDTRRSILEAALDRFSTDGYSATSMRSIARAVGVRESALYHHFKSKADILEALMSELGPGRARAFAQMDLEPMLALGAEQLFRFLVTRLVKSWAQPEEQKLARMVMLEGSRLPVERAFHPHAFIDQARCLLAELMEKLMARGLIRKLDPTMAALELMGPLMMLRMRFLVFTAQKSVPREMKALVEGHVSFFWEAVRP
jgi:AcrR family transcriptional regulator